MAFNFYMHERNIYRNQPDFTQIALDFPAFRKYAIPDAKCKKVYVDFSNPDALRMVTEILLKKDFNLDIEIPQGFLIPTVPQRLNYILWLEDLLNNISQEKKFISGIDIGTGPCAIFSILGARKNDWNFIATESSDDAIKWAKRNIEKNNLESNIRIVKVSPGTTLSEILSSNEQHYDFCLCNPPFFENIEEIRKKHHNSFETIADVAQKEEIFFKGGELSFVKNILSDSLIYKNRICLFTSMFGKKKSFLQILKEIKEIKDAKVTTTEFCQGNTIRWGIAWTFNESVQFEEVNRKIKAKKSKPPLEYQIRLKNSKNFNLHILLEQAISFLTSLQIPVTVTRSSQHFAELLLQSDKNTWIHQRRKRREVERQKKENNDLKKQFSTESCNIVSHAQVTTTDSVKNICTSFDTNVPNKNDDTVSSENFHIYTETEKISEHCKINNSTVSPKNCKKNISDSLHYENNNLELEKNKIYSEPISNIVSFENNPNNKRKDFSHKDSPISKKPRKYINEKSDLIKSEDICLERCTNVSLESKETDSKRGLSVKTPDTFIKTESSTEQSKTDKIIPNNLEVPNSICSKSSPEKLELQSKMLLDKSLQVKENICLSLMDHNYKQFTNKNETKSPSENNQKKCDKMVEVSPKCISNPTNHTYIAGDSKLQQYTKQTAAIVCDASVLTRNEEKVDNSAEGSVLYCHLQLIKGKDKIYVKMNCPPTADRNAMYQVFQLIKNKIK